MATDTMMGCRNEANDLALVTTAGQWTLIQPPKQGDELLFELPVKEAVMECVEV